MKRNELKTKEWSNVVERGMGAFLNPPTHPEHSYHVSSYCGDNFSMKLTTALETEWIEDEVKEKIQELLTKWEENKPSLDNEEIKDWIYHCHGYFKNVYVINGEQIIDSSKKYSIDNYQSVIFIRKYYPEYIPCPEDFTNAYWGTNK